MVEEFATMFGLDIFGVSVLIITIAIVIIVISIIVNVLMTRKSKEESVASKVLKKVELIQKGKLNLGAEKKEKIEEKTVTKEKNKVGDKDISMKEHLSNKFKPKIEKQLKTKVNLLDFKGKGKDFHALIEVGGVKVLLILDSSGKIIDYKKK